MEHTAKSNQTSDNDEQIVIKKFIIYKNKRMSNASFALNILYFINHQIRCRTFHHVSTRDIVYCILQLAHSRFAKRQQNCLGVSLHGGTPQSHNGHSGLVAYSEQHSR